MLTGTGFAAIRPDYKLNGAFIQFQEEHLRWNADDWKKLLDAMRAAKCNKIILQYLEKRNFAEPLISESYLVPEGAIDPIKIILNYAINHPGMSVYIGLRSFDLLEAQETLNSRELLRHYLSQEIQENDRLIKTLEQRYTLKTNSAFAGWYLPVEMANYPDNEDAPESDRWVNQLHDFVKALVSMCKNTVDKPVSISPYFNPEVDLTWLVDAAVMGKNYARFLKGAGLSTVMLQDGVGERNVPTAQIDALITPFIIAIKRACEEASEPGRPIAFWLNVESILKEPLPQGDIERFKKQIALGKQYAAQVVMFDFPNHFCRNGLYKKYLRLNYLMGRACPYPES